MDGCLLCLDINIENEDSIKVNSKQWQEHNIKLLLEKHFWPMDTIKSYSCLCKTCWQELYDFHIFYSHVKEAHVDVGKLIKKEKSASGLQVHTDTYNLETGCRTTKTETFESERLTECYLGQEAIIDQQDMLCVEQEQNLIIKNEPVENLSMEDNLLLDTGLTTEDPLEKCRTSSLVNFHQQTEQPSQIKQDPGLLNNNSTSDLTFDCDESDTNSNYDSETTEQSKPKRTRTYYNYREHRLENDKFIADNFKEMHCAICEIPIKNFRLLHKHFEEEHNQKGYVICCGTKFNSRSLLADHIRCHLNPEHFKCNQCDKIFTNHLRLERHIRTVHGKPVMVNNFFCDVCGKSFAEALKFETHKLLHLPEEKKFPCTECGKSYATAKRLDAHIKSIHLKKNHKICHICGASLSSSKRHKIHMDKHEGKTIPQVNCDICGLLLTCDMGLKRHKKIQHPEGGKKDHHCPTCPKVSPTLEALKLHIKTVHEKHREYKCTICEKIYWRKDALKFHMTAHTGNVVYTCSWCPKTFQTTSGMYSHRKKAHRKKWQEATRQKYYAILPQQHKVSDITKDNND